jgi:hypothetical protein
MKMTILPNLKWINKLRQSNTSRTVKPLRCIRHHPHSFRLRSTLAPLRWSSHATSAPPNTWERSPLSFPISHRHLWLHSFPCYGVICKAGHPNPPSTTSTNWAFHCNETFSIRLVAVNWLNSTKEIMFRILHHRWKGIFVFMYWNIF